MESANFILIQMNNTILMSANHLAIHKMFLLIYSIENNLNIHLNSLSLGIIAFLLLPWKYLQMVYILLAISRAPSTEHRANVGELLG